MKTITLFIVLLNLGLNAYAITDQNCNPELFSQSELGQPYAILRKTVRELTESQSAEMIQTINQFTTLENYNSKQLCSDKSANCVGFNDNWNFKKSKLIDNLGEHVKTNGEVYSRKPLQWPNDYYQLTATSGFYCSWDHSGAGKCIQWCQLIRNDDGIRD